jgi:hypothetical protein
MIYGQVLHLIHSGAELGEGMLMDSFRLQSIGQYCPSIRDINLCDTPFCENDVQVCGLFPLSFAAFVTFCRVVVSCQALISCFSLTCRCWSRSART